MGLHSCHVVDFTQQPLLSQNLKPRKLILEASLDLTRMLASFYLLYGIWETCEEPLMYLLSAKQHCHDKQTTF